MPDIILFDLDGTLSDSSEGIFNGYTHTLKTMNLDIRDREYMRKYIGPPLREVFSQDHNLNKDDTELAIATYREYYKEKGKFENAVYDGIPELLEKLRKDGKRMFVATSKITPLAIEILEHFALAKYFEKIVGAQPDGTIEKKSDVIRHLLGMVDRRADDKIIMVGDTYFDVIGALENGIDCIGVTYGFGTKEELLDAGAIAIAANAEELYCRICDLD